jgi:hypothetical protein
VDGFRRPKNVALLPLHLKETAVLVPVDNDLLRTLSTVAPDAVERLTYALSFLEDPTVYAGVTPEVPTPVASLEVVDVTRLCNVNNAVPHVGDILGTVRLFTRAEHLDTEKARRRILGHPPVTNDVIGRESLVYNVYVPKPVIRSAVRPGTVAGQIDMSQWFSQLALSPPVQEYYCWLSPDGTVMRSTRLSMGVVFSSLVASLVTNHICDVVLADGVSVVTATDNIRVAGPEAGVRAALTEIVARADLVHATINEDTSSTNWLDALITTSYDFLGESYHHDGVDGSGVAEQCSTAKSLRKITTTAHGAQRWFAGDLWSHHAWSCHMGILLYMSGTQRIEVFRFHEAMTFLRERARALQHDPELWNCALPTASPTICAELKEWTDLVLLNKPVPVHLPPGDATHICLSDASAWGWAAIMWDIAAQRCILVKHQWDDSFPQPLRDHSVRAEPEGVYRALCRALPADRPTRVIFHTDHQGFVWGYEAGYCKSDFYNQVVRKIARSFPQLEMDLRHTPGETNYVDGWSRGSEEIFNPEAAMRELRRLSGDARLDDYKSGAFARPFSGVSGLLPVGVEGAAASSLGDDSPQ